MSQEPPRVGIFLCADLDGPQRAVDLAAATSLLEESLSNVAVEVVPDLCQEPAKTRMLVARSGAELVVFGACAPKPPAREFQAWVRKAGLDPFGFELVEIVPGAGMVGRSKSVAGGNGSAIDVTLLKLRAAVARLRASAPSEVEQLRLRFLAPEGGVSRRSLLTMPPMTYEAVASIDPAACLGSKKCGLCEVSCPFEAIHAGGESPNVEKLSCRSCGVCVSACPVNAIGLPGASLDQYEAELRTLLSAEQTDLVFACRQKAGKPAADAELGQASDGELLVEVPCVGMVTPGWALQALAGGARSVGFLACGEECAARQGERVEGRVDYLQSLLGSLGVDRPDDLVRLVPTRAQEPPAVARAPAGHGGDVTLTEPAATATAFVELAALYGAPTDVSLDHGDSVLGIVEVREETCTLCGACAAACPTDALAIAQSERQLVLSFEAASCISCGRCVPACPEAATDTLTERAATDLAMLTSGRRALKEEAVALCKRCGQPVAPASMLDRIQDLIGGDPESAVMLKTLTDLCEDCRGMDGA